MLAGSVAAGVIAYRSATTSVYQPALAAPLPHADLSSVHQFVRGQPTVPAPTDMPAGTVEIPGLHIYAPLLSVGVDHDDVEVPFDAHAVGVYDGAAALTASAGSTVLVGHVTNGTVKGSFYPLAATTEGMTIWTRDGSGGLRSWVVRSVTVYPRTALPAELFVPRGTRRLVLITCGGAVTWVGPTRHYADNVVVEAFPDNGHTSTPS